MVRNLKEIGKVLRMSHKCRAGYMWDSFKTALGRSCAEFGSGMKAGNAGM